MPNVSRHKAHMSRGLKILISALAVVLALIHQFVPALTIDATTLLLIAVAILPWILQYLRGFEIPGVIKIDLADAKAATDKVTRTVQPGAGQLAITGHPPTVEVSQNDFFANLRTIYGSDPNLALVGFRIEIEKRVRELARVYKLGNERDPLQRLMRDLINRGVIPPDAGSGLIEMIALGNRAAHGAAVSPDAASWVLDVGPSILLQLDALISDGHRDG